MQAAKLERSFYNNNVVEVAQKLLGKKLYFRGQVGIITETEAYRGSDDEASHAFRGITKRSGIMYGPPGHVYVYMIYGMYHCLNIVTEPEGQASAVLIRGLKMDVNLNGPGKICRYLNITRQDNGIDLVTSLDCYLTESAVPEKIIATPRIGITKARDKLWRFMIG